MWFNKNIKKKKKLIMKNYWKIIIDLHYKNIITHNKQFCSILIPFFKIMMSCIKILSCIKIHHSLKMTHYLYLSVFMYIYINAQYLYKYWPYFYKNLFSVIRNYKIYTILFITKFKYLIILYILYYYKYYIISLLLFKSMITFQAFTKINYHLL